jgi:hypothetical protein
LVSGFDPAELGKEKLSGQLHFLHTPDLRWPHCCIAVSTAASSMPRGLLKEEKA